jgi:hypothetical protein
MQIRIRAKNAKITGAWSAAIKATTTPATSSSKIKVSLETNASTTIQMPTVAFKIQNTSNSDINLNDVTMRYYFTIDKESQLAVDFWSTVSKPNVSAKFVKMPIPSANADYYLEIGFTSSAGVLGAGAWATVSTWFNRTDWSVFDQSNDYSYINAPSYTETEKGTGYVSGVLNWR